MTRGIYRELNGWVTQHSARIRYDDGDEVDLPEERYRAQGYDPPFEKLPWKAQAFGNSRASKALRRR
jgi:hypothetical protein